jgi:Amidase
MSRRQTTSARGRDAGRLRRQPVDREALIASLGLEFTAAERALVFPLLDGFHAQGDALDKIPDPAPPVKYPRERGSRPADADNTLGAWYWRSSVKGAAAGALAGTTIALKDNIFLASVPTMVGSSVCEGFVPDEDATVAHARAGCRRRDPGEGALREPMPRREQPHGGHRPGAQPARSHARHRRLIIRLRDARGIESRGPGHRRRSGRVDSAASRLLRHRRTHTQLGPRAARCTAHSGRVSPVDDGGVVASGLPAGRATAGVDGRPR